jgi:hypothetical protein
MSVWAWPQKGQPGLSYDGEYTPTFTYTMPERTWGYNVGGVMQPTVYPAYTVEVVAPVQTTPPAQPNNEVIKRSDLDQSEFMLDRGCFKDDINHREFRARPKVDIPMGSTTIKACHVACISEHWSWAGLQNGRSRQVGIEGGRRGDCGKLII